MARCLHRIEPPGDDEADGDRGFRWQPDTWPMAQAVVSTVSPKARGTPDSPIPTSGKAAASTALPQPPSTSRSVPGNAARRRWGVEASGAGGMPGGTQGQTGPGPHRKRDAGPRGLPRRAPGPSMGAARQGPKNAGDTT
jgi:hypothetical protein